MNAGSAGSEAIPELIGRTLNLNSEGYEVVGILPRGFELPIREAELAIPLAPDADPLRNVRSSTNFLRAVGRLQPGYTREQAEADLTGDRAAPAARIW